VDYIGFGLLAIGLGALQIVLDKGEREDWFETHYIVILTVIAVICLIAVYFWERYHEHPIIEVRLFSDRTFLMACVMLFMVGFVLYATTLLLPQLAQTLMGYTAELAGLMIMPGGLALIVMMPVAGFLLSKYDARVMIAFGLLALGLAMLFMAHQFSLDADFKTMMWGRVLQTAGLAFLFIPINTAAYSYLPREKNNAASGLINLSRNIGASVGISFVTTMLTRRAQFHQTALTAHATAYSSQFNNTVQSMSQSYAANGPIAAQHQAYGQLYGFILRQSSMIAYLDNFWILGLSALVMIPFVFLMKRPPKGVSAAAH
jgi:DHA2 family multidrug resistance protein